MGRTLIWIGLALGLAAGGWVLFGAGGDEDEHSFVPVDLPYADDGDEEDGPALHGARRSATGSQPTQVGRYAIRGRVVDQHGDPVAEVAIVVRADGRAWNPSDPSSWGQSLEQSRRQILDRYDKTPDEQRPIVATGQADAAGRFDVRVPEYGKFRVQAIPPAPRVGAFGSVSLHAGKDEVDTVLTVLDGGALRGRVLDAKDQPVAASLQATFVRQVDGIYRQWTSELVTSSASEGTFHVPAAPHGKVGLTVTLAGGRRVSGFSVDIPQQGEFTIRLPATGGALEGSVTDAAGAPVANVHVIVRIESKPSEKEKASHAAAKGVTDGQGRYRINGLPVGQVVSIAAVADEFLPFRRPQDATTLEIPAAGAITFDVQLKRGGTISGRVTEAGGDTPIQGATVSLHPNRNGGGGAMHALPSVTTDAQGRYRFEHISPGAYVTLPEAVGFFLPQLSPGSGPRMAPMPAGQGANAPAALTAIMTAEGKEVVRNLALARGFRVEGRVVDSKKRAVADAEVFAQGYGLAQVGWAWGIGGRQAKAIARSGGDGRFVVEGLPPFAAWVLYARKEGHAGHYAEAFALGPDAAPASLTLELKDGGVLRGRVEGLSTTEAAAALVNFWGTSQELAGKNSGHTIAADGSFEIRGVPPGDWNLNVWANGRQGVQTQIAGLKAGETRADLVIKMKAGVRVEGEVVDSDGKPVGGMQVFLQVSGGGSWSSTSTDSAGRFEFRNAAEGRAQLNTWDGSGSQTPIGKAFQTKDSPVRLVYDRPTTVVIRGEVVAVDGTPIAVCRVQITIASTGRARPRPAQPSRGPAVQEAINGSFEIKTTGTGPWTVTASNARGEDGTVLNLRTETVVIKDPAGSVALRLKAGAILAGRVADTKNAGVADVQVQVGFKKVSTDAEGHFTVTGLDDGQVVVMVTPPAGMVRPRPQTVDSGSEDVVFTLMAGLSIQGIALGPDGEPLDRGYAAASWKAAGSSPDGSASAQIRAGGKFHVLGIPPGVRVKLQVQVWSAAGGTAFAPAIVEDIAPGATDIEVRLGGGLTIEGRIIGPDGKAPSGCYIYGRTKDGSKQTGWVQVNDKGTFRLGGLDAVPYEVRVMRQGGGALPPIQVVTPPASGIEIRLPKTVSLGGRITGLGDEEASGWRIRAWDEDGTQLGFTTAAADGTWHIATMADGRSVSVGAIKRGDDRYAMAASVKPGDEDVVLRVRAGRAITGTVEGGVKDDRVVAIVTAEGADGWRGRGSLQKDGTFRIGGLPPGRYKVTARTYGQDAKVVEIDGLEAGAAGVRLLLK